MKDIKVTLGETNNGPMLYLPNDMYVGRSLELYGEFSGGEKEFFDFVAQKGGAAIDIGANLGAHSMAMAQKYEHLFAFEPQPMLYKLLVANLSSFLNTTTYQAACGNDESLLHLPMLDYSMPNNFGGLGRECVENWSKEIQTTITMFQTQVRVIDKTDAIQATEKISLIKVDVEGMEKEVLEGARKTIALHQPVLYVENDKPQHSQALLDYIYNVLAYKAYWHITWLFNPNNFRHNDQNVFPGMASFNLICIPEDHWMKVTNAEQCTPQKPFVPEGCKV